MLKIELNKKIYFLFFNINMALRIVKYEKKDGTISIYKNDPDTVQKKHEYKDSLKLAVYAMSIEGLYTIKDIGKKYNLSTTTVQKYIKEGELLLIKKRLVEDSSGDSS